MFDPELPLVFNQRYVFGNGPDAHPSDLEEGCNCQFEVHEGLRRDFGISLPPYYLSREIWHDPDGLFRPVTEVEVVERGDVGLFGQWGIRDSRKFHLARVVYKTPTGEPVFRDASFSEGGISDRSLSQLFRYPHYAVLYAIRRHKELDAFGVC
ncbi:hypothetical protein HY948_01995 [Candidatus Gottesmanbacteria bacterium]|nr:hypothetical protein [Candidatus Gottesmanbacteria bacterium]